MSTVGFVSISRVRWVLKNLIEPRVQGVAAFVIKGDGSWRIEVSDAAGMFHPLLIGENEHELDIILDKFQNHLLEVKNGKVEKSSRKDKPRKIRHVGENLDDLYYNDSSSDSDSFFD